jgi:hypothetical protein
LHAHSLAFLGLVSKYAQQFFGGDKSYFSAGEFFSLIFYLLFFKIVVVDKDYTFVWTSEIFH